ncbi:MAG: DJ-1/PfpI family protein [Gemmatimonadales bacterium]
MNDDVSATRIAMVLFPNLTQLDLTGPFEVLAAMPGAAIDLVWHRIEPVSSNRGFVVTPTATFEDYGVPDVLFVPGGAGTLEAMEDEPLIDFVRRSGAHARLVTSVCTGSFILGAAGLLKGKRATSHWTVVDQLALLGAIAVNERVVQDGNVITGAGVTSGIDFALTVAARLHGEEVARRIQLQIEYDPAPPFDGGSVATADPMLVQRLRARNVELTERRGAVAERLGRRILAS